MSVELLAPAGDLQKLKIAVMYGANAVFIGGEKFSLRSRASNFTLEDIKKAVILLISMVLIFMLLAIFFLMRQILRVLLSI